MSEAAEHQASANDVEVVRRLNSLFEQLDVGSLRDVVEDTAEGQSFKGLEQWMDLWRVWLAAWESYSLEARDYETRGEHVLVEVVHRGRGRGSGLDVELPQTQLWQIRDGRAIRCRIYASRAGAEAALSGT